MAVRSLKLSEGTQEDSYNSEKVLKVGGRHTYNFQNCWLHVTLVNCAASVFEVRDFHKKKNLDLCRLNRPCGPPIFLCGGYRVSFPRIKQSTGDIHLSLPYNVNFKNACGCNSTAPCMPAWSGQGQALIRHVRKFAKSDYGFRHVCLSVCPHGTTRPPLDGFFRNFNIFSKICRENSSSIKTGQK